MTISTGGDSGRRRAGGGGRSPWYGSFYWRIAFSFVAFVIVVLVAQSVIFSYMMARTSPTLNRSPNNLATIVAADLGSVLAQEPGVDLQEYLEREYSRAIYHVFVVMKDGRVASSSKQPLSNEVRRSVDATLRGSGVQRGGDQPDVRGPIVTAPIQVLNELVGMVVLPPPPPGGVAREIGRMLSLPWTVLLILATALAAVVIFAPARRRLRALEEAAERLGAGDSAARAPETGTDEIARVARAFNRMAAELTARDEAVRTSDRLRRQMFADVSHELKTPLTAMRGYLETLHMTDVNLDPETRERYLGTVERETRRLERIVTDLLDLTRYENDVGSLEIRLFAIQRLFDHVIERHAREAGARNIAFRVDVADRADQLHADPDRIEQVIENLVSNALRHTPPGATIELRARAADDIVYLSVINPGDGIDPAHIRHVFDRFYKVDASRSAVSGGSGLGLSIARAIVERHGGTMAVTSENGLTEFTAALPHQSGDRA